MSLAPVPQLSQEERRHILSLLPRNAKALVISSARLYHTQFSGGRDVWMYTGLKGWLTFGHHQGIYPDTKLSDLGRRASPGLLYGLWLVDISNGEGVIWKHQISRTFQYRPDKPFFHVFPGAMRMFGFLFDNDAEAGRLYREISYRLPVPASRPRKLRKPAPTLLRSPPPAYHSASRLRTLMISKPIQGSFVHVSHAHAGYNEKGLIAASDHLGEKRKHAVKEVQGATKPELDGHQGRRIHKNVDSNGNGLSRIRGILKNAEPRKQKESHAHGHKRRHIGSKSSSRHAGAKSGKHT